MIVQNNIYHVNEYFFITMNEFKDCFGIYLSKMLNNTFFNQNYQHT